LIEKNHEISDYYWSQKEEYDTIKDVKEDLDRPNNNEKNNDTNFDENAENKKNNNSASNISSESSVTKKKERRRNPHSLINGKRVFLII